MSDFEARPFELTAKDTEGKVKEVTERLEAGVRELFESERYQAYLKAMSKFHDYSLNNTLLILMQKPDASLVAGFGKWRNDFERHVKRGEKGIKIFAPAPYTIKKEAEKIDPDTGQPVIGADGKPVMEQREIKIPAFKVVSVFDVSQTDGKEIPDLSVDALTGSVEQYEDFWRVLKEVSPVPVELEKIEGGAHGYYSLTDKRIAVDEGMSELQTIKTLIHEIAHAKLHDIDLNAPTEEMENRPNRRTREVEAESIAFTVCQHFGLDTSDYSFGYVAGWSSDKEIKELKASLETIRTTASALITEIEERLQALSQQRETAQEQETAALTEPQPENTFSIYQLKGGDETRDYRFEPLERLRELGLSVQKDNYDLVYSAPLADGETLEDLFVRFNVERPEDFTGHSLSVSDVIVLHHGELQSAHYCDSFGFTEVPEFLQQEKDIRQETAQPVFAQIPPERQQAIRDEVQATLQMLVDTDMRLSGEVLQGTLDALAAQGYVLQDGVVQRMQQAELPMPDPTITVQEMNEYGYKWDGMLPLQEEAARRLFENEGVEIYRIYEDNTEGAVLNADEITEHAAQGGIFGVEKEAWQRHLEKPQQEQEAAEQTATQPESTFAIYQLKDGEETRDYRFEPLDRLRAVGLDVQRDNYELVYSAPLADGESLEDIYRRFNIDHPADFTGHSLSVSDIVVLRHGDTETAHYCDSFGFTEVPEFLQQQEQTAQKWNGIDGLLNDKTFMPDTTPTEQANALIDLAEQDGQRLGNAERGLIVQYHEQVQDLPKTIALVNELCEKGFEQQHGHLDYLVKQRIDAEITAAVQERQQAEPLPPSLDPAVQPVVTIIWSESDKLREGEQMPLARADALFKSLDETRRTEREQPGYAGSWYDKTNFPRGSRQLRGTAGLWRRGRLSDRPYPSLPRILFAG